jgi:hypothetical protein
MLHTAECDLHANRLQTLGRLSQPKLLDNGIFEMSISPNVPWSRFISISYFMLTVQQYPRILFKLLKIRNLTNLESNFVAENEPILTRIWYVLASNPVPGALFPEIRILVSFLSPYMQMLRLVLISADHSGLAV